jgi:hypothetical protein
MRRARAPRHAAQVKETTSATAPSPTRAIRRSEAAYEIPHDGNVPPAAQQAAPPYAAAYQMRQRACAPYRGRCLPLVVSRTDRGSFWSSPNQDCGYDLGTRPSHAATHRDERDAHQLLSRSRKLGPSRRPRSTRGLRNGATRQRYSEYIVTSKPNRSSMNFGLIHMTFTSSPCPRFGRDAPHYHSRGPRDAFRYFCEQCACCCARRRNGMPHASRCTRAVRLLPCSVGTSFSKRRSRC